MYIRNDPKIISEGLWTSSGTVLEPVPVSGTGPEPFQNGSKTVLHSPKTSEAGTHVKRFPGSKKNIFPGS